MVSKVFTLSLLILITSTIASSLKETVHRSQECYENGSYFGNVIDISRQYSPEDCANHCVYFANCNYFTFDPTKQMCEALKDYYDGISTHCPNCISGRGSHFCGARGFCKVCMYHL